MVVCAGGLLGVCVYRYPEAIRSHNIEEVITKLQILIEIQTVVAAL